MTSPRFIYRKEPKKRKIPENKRRIARLSGIALSGGNYWAASASMPIWPRIIPKNASSSML